MIHANTAALRLMEEGDGLRRHRQTVQASGIGDSVARQVAMNHVIAANAGHDAAAQRYAPPLRLRRAHGKPLIVAIVPAEARAVGPDDVAVMIYVFDPALDTERRAAAVDRPADVDDPRLTHVIAPSLGWTMYRRSKNKKLLSVPISRAMNLMAASRTAQEQSVAAIRVSIRLLRQPSYPQERSAAYKNRPDDATV